jgi:shikimate kinase
MILKLKRTPALYLVGFMASGKSTVGRALADDLGWNFVDLDEEIERQQGTTIAHIFETHGEDEFRQMESAVLQALVHLVQCGRPQVISLGGGTFVGQQNFELISNNGISIWLDCPLVTIERRLGETYHRPLARDPQRMRDLYESRRPSYARADYRIEIGSDDPAAAVTEILRLPLF